MNEIVSFLKRRRSVTAKVMKEGRVLDEHLKNIIECGMRVPDHGALNPWKIIIIANEKRSELGKKILAVEFKKNNPNANEEELKFESRRFMRANVVLAIISTPVKHPKIPKWEMELSSGAVCQNILIAAQSYNYACQWITEWYSYNKKMLLELGGTPSKDKIAGFIYIGEKDKEPLDRRRPNSEKIITYI